jgi:hypothetical protein
MYRLIFLSFAVFCLSSCTLYHQTYIDDKLFIREFGFCKYQHRPIEQIEEDCPLMYQEG